MSITHQRRRRGATAIEYGLIAAGIIVAVIGVLQTTGASLAGEMKLLANTMVSAGQTVSYGVFSLSSNTTYVPGESSGQYITNANGLELFLEGVSGQTSLSQYLATVDTTMQNRINSNQVSRFGVSNTTSSTQTIPGPQGPGKPGSVQLPSGWGMALINKSDWSGYNDPSINIWSVVKTNGNVPNLTATQVDSFRSSCAAIGGTLRTGTYGYGVLCTSPTSPHYPANTLTYFTG